VGIILKKISYILILVLLVSGCGLIPAYRRSLPDSQKVANMALYGGSKSRVKSDFGIPDEKREENELEIWVYHNREDGRTVEFSFDDRGRLVGTLWGK